MDLLYSRYASPMELMRLYIEQGRFGEFVTEILEMDSKRKQEAAKEKDDDRLWAAYIRSMSEKSFIDWKNDLFTQKQPEDYSMTDEQVASEKDHARDILKKISPV